MDSTIQKKTFLEEMKVSPLLDLSPRHEAFMALCHERARFVRLAVPGSAVPSSPRLRSLAHKKILLKTLSSTTHSPLCIDVLKANARFHYQSLSETDLAAVCAADAIVNRPAFESDCRLDEPRIMI